MLISTVRRLRRGPRDRTRPRIRSDAGSILLLSLGSNLALLFYFKYLLFFAETRASVCCAASASTSSRRASASSFRSASASTPSRRSATRSTCIGASSGRSATSSSTAASSRSSRSSSPGRSCARPRRSRSSRSARPSARDFAIGLRRVLCRPVPQGRARRQPRARSSTPASRCRPPTLTAIDVWTLAFLFGFQIYFDFSGYSHIALGCARMMGIQFPENFDYPYLATSPREFWRRWHISLSSWIRDYLYLPLACVPSRTTARPGRARHGRDGGSSADPSTARARCSSPG